MSSVFVKKLYSMIFSGKNNNIEWVDDDSFIIHDPGKLYLNMRNLFKSTNVNSFVRQLHIYGFRKVGGSTKNDWIYHHKFFTKNGKFLDKIKRNNNTNYEILLEKIYELNIKIEEKYEDLERKYNDLKIDYIKMKEKHEKLEHQYTKLHISSNDMTTNLGLYNIYP